MDEERNIEAAISEFIKAYNSGDLEKVLAYYGEDLIKVRNGAARETKPDTARRISAVFENFQTRVDVVNEEIRASGEFAFVRGTFKVSLTPKAGGDQQTMERRFLEIWQKVNGRWIVIRTMDNS